MPVAPSLSPWLPGLQAQSEALLLPRLGSVVAVPQLLGPVWAHRRNDDRRDGGERRAPEVLQSESTAATTAAAAAAAAAATAAARQADAPPSPVAELPSLPLDGYLRQRCFHRIATDFPGVQLVHEEPYVLVVPGFLSAPVCEALIRKMDARHAQPSDGATRERGRTRTSCSAILRHDECAGVRARIARLAAVSVEQLQPLKVTPNPNPHLNPNPIPNLNLSPNPGTCGLARSLAVAARPTSSQADGRGCPLRSRCSVVTGR